MYVKQKPAFVKTPYDIQGMKIVMLLIVICEMSLIDLYTFWKDFRI